MLSKLTWRWSADMIKVLWHRFRQCFDTFTMLLVQGSSATGLFRHLSDYDFRVRSFGNSKSMKVIFFSEYLKFNRDFENPAKIWWKVFCFSGNNSVWIGIVKLSLLRTGYFSSGGNVLKSSCKIFHVNKRDFFQLTLLGSDQLIW